MSALSKPLTNNDTVIELPYAAYGEENQDQQTSKQQVKESFKEKRPRDSTNRNPASFIGEDDKYHCPYCRKPLKRLKWFTKHLGRHSEWRLSRNN